MTRQDHADQALDYASLQGRALEYHQTLEAAWLDHLAPRDEDAPTVISTFAGGGGSSLGYSMAGYRELAAVEWGEVQCRTLRRNFEGLGTQVLRTDISELEADQLLDQLDLEPGQLDVLDGSPPCQGFSTAGKRDLADGRNALYLSFSRLLRGLNPRAFVMENVRGMAVGKMRPVFREILEDLQGAGYEVSARILIASGYDVPQARPRVIFIGVRSDLDVLPSHPAPTQPDRPFTVHDAIGHLSDHPPDPSIGHVYPRRISDYAGARLWRCRKGENHTQQNRRARWTQPSPTILASAAYGALFCTVHPEHDRPWTELEARLLSSFPAGYELCKQDVGDVYLQVGNCVPPLMARAIASHVRDLLP